MKAGLNEEYLVNHTTLKTAFLSYYISMYNSVSQELGMADGAVSVDEIYEFIQDLKHEAGKMTLEISKEDIRMCFSILQTSGICH